MPGVVVCPDCGTVWASDGDHDYADNLCDTCEDIDSGGPFDDQTSA